MGISIVGLTSIVLFIPNIYFILTALPNAWTSECWQPLLYAVYTYNTLTVKISYRHFIFIILKLSNIIKCSIYLYHKFVSVCSKLPAQDLT